MKTLWTWAVKNRKPLLDLLALVVVFSLAFFGRVESAVAVALLVLAAENSKLAAKVERHTAQLAQVLGDLAKAGVNVTVHNYGAAEKSLAQSVVDGARLAQAIQTDRKTVNS